MRRSAERGVGCRLNNGLINEYYIYEFLKHEFGLKSPIFIIFLFPRNASIVGERRIMVRTVVHACNVSLESARKVST